MKVIAIHADSITFKPIKKAINSAEDVKIEETKVNECLVVLTAVEKRDENLVKESAKRLAEETSKIAEQVKAENIVLYPYAHLSSDLCHPDKAIEIMKEAEKILKKDYKVVRAPFGWYKSFSLNCKGHPLSELSRAFGGKELDIKDVDVSKAVNAEKKLSSKWYIIDTKGKLTELKISDGKISGYKFSKDSRLEKFSQYELAKVRQVNQEPPHVSYMKKLSLVDYEPGSDPGNLRYYPKGRMIKALLEEWVTKKTLEYGALEVETPIMYDYEHPSLKSYLNRFPARQYTVQTPNKKTFLRFSACFGQFLMAHDLNLSYKDLPLKLYELTKYSFRAEQRGELTGLRRLRAFTMPDCHAFVSDIDQAKEEMLVRFDLAKEILSKVGLNIPGDLEIGIRVTKDFYDKNKDFILSLVKKWGKPALLEMWDEKFFYFVAKYEWNFVDVSGKAAALTTDQIDVENATTYDINFIDKDGKKKLPIILHLSPSGAIERVIYALLEKAYYDEKSGKLPLLPLWLSPTQVRIIPVSDEHLKLSEKLTEDFSKLNIRVDIDDQRETISKRIRNAELEWVPYVLVVGDKESKGKLTVRIRKENKQEQMTKENFVKKIKKETEGMPFRPLPLSKLLSKRPVFRG
ncbi:MAG TPA: threonine--tRNA ligase [Candidatus Nanoarchaeia archaeon]|nr:threonine--tRNA ligase [Candidatus Nanoarchaeia archaeon]